MIIVNNSLKIENKEEKGKDLLRQSFDFMLQNKFEIGYEYLKDSIRHTTCYCFLEIWIRKNNHMIEIFKNQSTNNHEYLFCKSFVLSQNIDTLEESLDSIKKYLEIINDEFGNYLISQILFKQNKNNESLKYLELSNDQLELSCVKYSLGKLNKEKRIEMFYSSFMINPFSLCCLEDFHRVYKESDLKLASPIFPEKNSLIDIFCRENVSQEFKLKYKLVLKSIYKKDGLFNIKSIKNLNNFILFLKENLQFFNPTLHEYLKSSHDFYIENRIDEDYCLRNNVEEDYYDENLDFDQQDPEFWDNQ